MQRFSNAEHATTEPPCSSVQKNYHQEENSTLTSNPALRRADPRPKSPTNCPDGFISFRKMSSETGTGQKA